MGYTYDYPHPAVAVDVALFRGNGDAREILLIQRGQPPFAGCWALPGGFIDIDEDLEPAARRELREETGLEAGDLAQLGAFGAPDRDPRERVISIVFTGTLPDAARSRPAAGDDAAAARWFPLDALPAFAFDHAEIVGLAVRRLGGVADD